MMLTLREQLIRAVLARLNGTDKPADVPLTERVSYTAASSANVPRMLLYPVREAVQRHERSPVCRRELTIRIDCRAAALAHEDADALANSMVAWATAALAGQRFGGLAHDTTEVAIDWSFEPADYLLVEASLEFAISYQTQLNDQTQR